MSATAATNVRRLRTRMRATAPGEHFYVALLGLDVFESRALHALVVRGIPYPALEQLREALDVSTARIAELIGVPARTLVRRKDSGRLEPDESDRLLRLARTVGITMRLFEGDLEESRRWLSAPSPALGDVAPLDLAITGVGAREVEYLVGRLEHGIPL